MTNSRGYHELGFACVDTARHERRGFPEVIFCQNKTPDEIIRIARVLAKNTSAPLLLTRLDPKFFARIRRAIKGIKIEPRAHVAYRPAARALSPKGVVVIACAGTSDIPVAEEAAITAGLMGVCVRRIYDVGVAGVHRVLDKTESLRAADAIVVCAGMEGALASIVSGLVSCPVIGVPTSCGYGANFGGVSALLTMLNSCSPGVSVVNIDNGFGAGYMAAMIARRPARGTAA